VDLRGGPAESGRVFCPALTGHLPMMILLPLPRDANGPGPFLSAFAVSVSGANPPDRQILLAIRRPVGGRGIPPPVLRPSASPGGRHRRGKCAPAPATSTRRLRRCRAGRGAHRAVPCVSGRQAGRIAAKRISLGSPSNSAELHETSEILSMLFALFSKYHFF
jgi:hypothetical protein